MTNATENKPIIPEQYYPLILEDSILAYLKMDLQNIISEPRLVKSFLKTFERGDSNSKEMDEETVKYALTVLEAEGLIAVFVEDDGTRTLRITRDGLRSTRAGQRMAFNRLMSKLDS